MDKALKELSNEVGRVSVPTYIHDFLVENPEVEDFSAAYTKLKQMVPDSVPVPTMNEALLYYNLARMQKLADAQFNAIAKNEKKLKQLRKFPDENEKEIRWYEKNIENLERRYHAIARDVIKYSNSGVDRDTPKNINIQNNTTIKLSDIHDKIRDIKNVTPKESS